MTEPLAGHWTDIRQGGRFWRPLFHATCSCGWMGPWVRRSRLSRHHAITHIIGILDSAKGLTETC